MIIKSHLNGNLRAQADYLKDKGENETTRLVEISDIDASDLEEAFIHMWVIAYQSRARCPLHHISINPYKDERLTDDQVRRIVERCERKFGYKAGDHQRVIVEHVKKGRQHFHVVWNRASLVTGQTVNPGHTWKKSKQVARIMEKELGLRPVVARRVRRARFHAAQSGRPSKVFGRYQGLVPSVASMIREASRPVSEKTPESLPSPHNIPREPKRPSENIPDSEKPFFQRPEMEAAELLAWAWENGRTDILAGFGIHIGPDFENWIIRPD